MASKRKIIIHIDDLEKELNPYFDGVQEKHHPESMPRGYERQLGDHFPEDDMDEEP